MRLLISMFIIFAVFSPCDVRADEIKVQVNGLVCGFCAGNIERRATRDSAVESIDVDLDTTIVTLKIKDGMSLTEAEARKIIKEAGYEVEKFIQSSEPGKLDE